MSARSSGETLDRNAPAYRAAVRAVVERAGTPDGATLARLRAVLAAPRVSPAERLREAS